MSYFIKNILRTLFISFVFSVFISEQSFAQQADTLEIFFVKRSTKITKQSKKDIQEFLQNKPTDTNSVVEIAYSQPMKCTGGKFNNGFQKMQSIAQYLEKQGIKINEIVLHQVGQESYSFKVFWRENPY